MKNLMNILIFKKGDKEMKVGKKICILCKRVLLKEEDRNWWSGYRIRKYKKDFQGDRKIYIIGGKEFKSERGDFVCRDNSKCIKERRG